MTIKRGVLIAEGNTAQVFAWGDSHVLKLYREGYPPSEAERELELVQAVITAGIRTPAIMEIETIDGRPGLIFERLDGPTMLESLLGRPGTSLHYPALMAKLHADLHQIVGATVPTLHARLRNRLQNPYTEVATSPQSAELLQPSPQSMPSASMVTQVVRLLDALPAGEALCHGDFGPQNILMTEDGPVVIDWVDATQGIPAADVARTVVLFRYAVLPPNIDDALRKQLEEYRHSFLEEYLTHYAKLTGTDWDEINCWLLPVAGARLINEQIPENERARLYQVLRSGLSTS